METTDLSFFYRSVVFFGCEDLIAREDDRNDREYNSIIVTIKGIRVWRSPQFEKSAPAAGCASPSPPATRPSARHRSAVIPPPTAPPLIVVQSVTGDDYKTLGGGEGLTELGEQLRFSRRNRAGRTGRHACTAAAAAAGSALSEARPRRALSLLCVWVALRTFRRRRRQRRRGARQKKGGATGNGVVRGLVPWKEMGRGGL
jgi:hypothetical protein